VGDTEVTRKISCPRGTTTHDAKVVGGRLCVEINTTCDVMVIRRISQIGQVVTH
jgi:hypothetical protein